MGTTGATRRSLHRTRAAERGAGVAGAALCAAALAACSGSPSVPGAGSGAGGTVTVTSTTTVPTTSPAASGTTPAGGSTGGGRSTPPPVGGGTSAAPGSCTAASVRISAEPSAGGGSAGHLLYNVVVTNTGTQQCTVQGYPGVSLVADGTGKQLGAAADRVPAEAPLMRLEPGKSAVSQVQVTQAASYGGDCGITDAAGFRIYLPGETHAAFAPTPVKACTSPTVKLLSVRPFNT